MVLVPPDVKDSSFQVDYFFLNLVDTVHGTTGQGEILGHLIGYEGVLGHPRRYVPPLQYENSTVRESGGERQQSLLGVQITSTYVSTFPFNGKELCLFVSNNLGERLAILVQYLARK
jgi:hypothetical protein